MMFNRLRTATLCLALATTGVMAHAQTSTQGAIAGTVLDASGAAVSGASVIIRNIGTNAEVKLVADASGYFKAPLLEPGSYTVTVNSNGFASYEARNVTVQVSQVTAIEPHLAISGAQQSVVVSEQTPIINSESPDFTAALSPETLQEVPINNRRWSSLAMTTPGVVSDSSGFGLVSVRGVSPIMNNIMIDGADDNQAYYAEERGRTREAYSTSANAVREFTVNTGVYSAEFGRAAGGVIASVTKSGTNHLHGQAYFYDRQSSWNAFNNFAKLSVLDSTSGQYVSTHIKPKDLRKIYGFTAGGALLKDKLFWMYTFDQHAHIFPVTGVPYNPTLFYTLPDAVDTNNYCNATTAAYSAPSSFANAQIDNDACTLAARQKITYAQGAALYTKWLNALNGDIGTVTRAGYQEINTPKVDWQVNTKNHVSFLYHRLRWDSPGGVQTAPTDNYSQDAQGNDYVKLDYGVAKMTSLISNSISNEILYQFSRELNDESQQPFTDYTKNNMTAGNNVPQVSLATSLSGFTLGSPYYSYRKALPDEHKWQIGDTLYYTRKNHSFKFGTDNIHNYDLMNNTYESNGVFTYSYLGNFINDQVNFINGKTGSTCDTTGARNGKIGSAACYSKFVQGFGAPTFAIDTTDIGLFAQDNWKVSPRLTLELGIRYDYEVLPKAVNNLTTATGNFVPYSQLNNNPSDKSNFGPRVGFAYDIFGGGKTVLRGGYGMYYGRINNGNLLNIRLNTGSPNGQYTTTYKAVVSGTTPAGPQFPNIVTGTGVAPTPSSYYLASNLHNPAVQEFDLMLQQDMGHGTVFGLSYLGGLGRKLPNFLNLNLAGQQNVTITVVDSTGKSPIANGTQFVVPTYTAYGNTAMFGSQAANYQAITEMVSNINSNYNALVAEVQNRTLKRVTFDASYTWSHALDFAQNASTTTSTNNWYDPFSNPRINYGNSSFNVPNRFVAYALFNVPDVKTANKWVKYALNDWSVNDSFQMQNGLPFSPSISSSANYNSSLAKSTGWNGSGGASFIPALGVNSDRYPRRIVNDIRVEKSIPMAHNTSLDLIANAFNLANHQNVDGLNTTFFSLASTGSLTGTATYNANYKQVTSSNNSGFLYTPRQIEISARFNF